VIPGSHLVGNGAAQITHPAALHEATAGSVSWLRKGNEIPGDWAGTALIVAEGTVGRLSTNQALIVCRNPRMGIGYTLRELFADLAQQPRIVGGESETIHPRAVIGSEGNSLEWDDEHARWFRIPAVAGVVIEQNVTIGPMAVVVRGVLTDTVIEEGTDICNHVNVGHGARIGRHCIIAPFAAIGGSSVIGERVIVWQHAAIKNSITIGAGATIGQCANVLRDVPPGETWVGNPARRIT